MKGRWLCLVVGMLLCMPTLARAQANSGISGVVTDSTGGVLPGVTVEVSSPVLIEGSRVAVTDGSGRYNATQLESGTYSVTFTLPGFSVVLREGVELTADFTAPINAQLAVGSLEETVTVTGATPTVDVQNVRTQNTLSRETLDVIPNAQTLASIASLTLGVKMVGVVQQDVGGNQGEMGSVSVHNNRSNDQKISMEGMNTNNSMGTNGGNFHAGQHYNMEAMQEVTLAHSGMGADTETGGAQINYIPKDGGNNFSATARATYINTSFQSENLSPELISRGATTPPSVKRVYDMGGSVGGPLKRDSLWFYTSHRWWGDQTYQPGAFFNKTQGTMFYTPDESRPAWIENYNQDNSGRLTWQASSKDKIAYYGNYGNQCICYLAVGAVIAPEASFHNHLPENHLSQVTWNRVQSSRLLFEGGFTFLHNPFGFWHEERGETPGTGRQGVTYDHIPILELAGTKLFNARSSGGLPYNDYDGPGGGLSPAGQENGRFSVSYVTGSHAFKAGFSTSHGRVDQNGRNNVVPGFGPARYFTYGGTPILVEQFAHPKLARVDFRNSGIYAQDMWTINKVTLNIGVRYDMFDGWSPAQTTPGGVFVPAFSALKKSDTPTWRDISPRLGVAYDLTGDGKTALKFSTGRYVAGAGAGTVQPTNPVLSIASSVTRSWGDANGDRIPQESEMGPLSNVLFGTPQPTRSFNDDMMTKNRQYTWQISAGVEREINANMGVSLTYFRTMHYNQTVNDNTKVTSADYSPYSILAPAGVPVVGGTTISGLYNVNPDKYGQIFNDVRNQGDYGTRSEVFNGVDMETRLRLDNGTMLQGGVSFGQTKDNNCFTVDSPQQLYHCQVTVPWWAGNGQIKFAGSYPLPYGIELSGVYQNLPGVPILANVIFFPGDIVGLGRTLSGPNVTIPVIEPNTQYEDRINQVDFRMAKVFRGDFGRFRLTFDLYNMFNTNTVQQRNNSYGPAAAGGAGWGTPTRILSGRLIKWYVQYSF